MKKKLEVSQKRGNCLSLTQFHNNLKLCMGGVMKFVTAVKHKAKMYKNKWEKK